MVTLFLLIAAILFALVALKVNEPAAFNWLGAGLFFLTLAFLAPLLKALL